ncbi:hypothetical protein VC83_07910 [Pseudogymnoascus destructans]|uniref:Myb-like domain-containing protein n=1 Tax=Pseudogymnoascus destructans TaxID=655981 RepID=A0A177A4E5_9PEZI|nr:uncharacterized protein VC83_07910 [Pseudogymnoascus destructans]OAF55804.1 hypothetical protein VC83_07910 [Pseudogymnoascus destructans]
MEEADAFENAFVWTPEKCALLIRARVSHKKKTWTQIAEEHFPGTTADILRKQWVKMKIENPTLRDKKRHRGGKAGQFIWTPEKHALLIRARLSQEKKTWHQIAKENFPGLTAHALAGQWYIMKKVHPDLRHRKRHRGSKAYEQNWNPDNCTLLIRARLSQEKKAWPQIAEEIFQARVPDL